MGWAIVSLLDGPGSSPGPKLVFISTRGPICKILSLMSSAYYSLSFEVGGLDYYVFMLDYLCT